MATRYHINPETGKPGVCNPVVTGVCKYGADAEHFSSQDDAREAFEASMKSETFSVVVSNGSEHRSVQTFDAKLESNISRLEVEFNGAADKNDWIAGKVEAVTTSHRVLAQTLPGSPERTEALDSRTKAREELLAADLVAWRSSEYHNDETEGRMKEATIAVSDADSSIEKALADTRGLSEVASQYGISPRDAENILEVTHQDYLRPRQGLKSSIGDLSANEHYASTTAYVFRVDADAVKGVLSYAANYSKVEAKPVASDLYSLLND